MLCTEPLYYAGESQKLRPSLFIFRRKSDKPWAGIRNRDDIASVLEYAVTDDKFTIRFCVRKPCPSPGCSNHLTSASVRFTPPPCELYLKARGSGAMGDEKIVWHIEYRSVNLKAEQKESD